MVSYAGAGTVYTMKPGAALGDLTVLQAVDAAPRPGLTAVRAVSDWRLAVDEKTGLPASKPHHYISPDGTTFIPAGKDFVSGAMSWGVKSADLIRGFGLAPVAPGQPVYFTSEAEVTTWRMTLGPDGNVTGTRSVRGTGRGERRGGREGERLRGGRTDLRLRARRAFPGDDRDAGRPIQVVFGGPDRKTLFITSRDALYGVRMGTEGRWEPRLSRGSVEPSAQRCARPS